MRAALIAVTGLLLAACGTKSELKGGEPLDGSRYDGGPSEAGMDAAPDAGVLMVDCGRRNHWTSPSRAIAISATVTTTDPSPTYTWQLVSHPAGSTAALMSANETAGIKPDTTGDYSLHFEVSDRWGDVRSCDYVVHSVVGPPVAICPEGSLSTRPGVPLRVEGAGYDDVRVVSYAWAITTQPPMSMPSVMPTDMPVTTFVGDRTGGYDLTLTVADDTGAANSCVAHVDVTTGPMVDCGDPTPRSVPTRQPATFSATATSPMSSVTTTWSVTMHPMGSTATVMPPTGTTTTITPDVVGPYTLHFTATDTAGISASCDIMFDAVPSPPTVTCPPEIDTTPLSTVDVTATVVADYPIAAIAWSTASEPPGSGAMPPSPPNAATTHFTPDVAGDYRLHVVVTDDHMQTGDCTTLVRATAAEGLRVELYWNPPDHSCGHHPEVTPCDPTDVDLHLLDPRASSWFNSDDCYYANCQGAETLDWGTSGPTNDPHLDLDTTTGFGPENTNIEVPETATYEVGVHHYYDHGGGPATVYVNIYCGVGATTPIASFGPVVLNGINTDSFSNDFWRVANVAIGGGTCVVTPIVRSDGSMDIVTGSVASMMR